MRAVARASLVLAVLLAVTSASCAGANYVMHALRMPDGCPPGVLDINDSGQITGIFFNLEDLAVWDNYSSQPQIIHEENATLCGRLINNSGVVAGYMFVQGYKHIFTWSSASGLTDLVGPREEYLILSAMNDNGTMVGVTGEAVCRAYSLSATGEITFLDNACGGSGGRAFAINNTGYIVGGSWTPDTHHESACVWREGMSTLDLGTFGGTWSVADAVNDNGQVAGVYGDDEGWAGAFLWRSGSPTIMIPTSPLLDDGGAFGVVGITNDGVVVGNASMAGEHTVVTWSQSGGWTIVGQGVADAVNNSGWIVGQSPYATQAVVWVPVPEPSSLLALCAGLVPLMLRRRR